MGIPSIFNDVIGPVMRGPSSSHCAASLRVGRMCRDLMDGQIERALIEFDPDGSLATTHESQGSDMGLFAGFLGWETEDARLPDYRQGVRDAGMHIEIAIVPLAYDHPNTYKICLQNADEKHDVVAISTGGGIIEIISIDEAPVQMAGDYCELLLFVEQPEPAIKYVQHVLDFDTLSVHQGRNTFIQVKMQAFPDETKMAELAALEQVTAVRRINPVLPVRGRKDMQVPFQTCDAMLQYNQDKNKELWELAVAYEAARGTMTEQEVVAQAGQLMHIMRAAVDTGLAGTHYEDRILGSQSPRFRERLKDGVLIPGNAINNIIMSVTAIMETKSSMGVIVAAPTAGSCGAMPGALIGLASACDIADEDVVRGLLIAGLIGIFITGRATFAAEVGGCQAECGSGSGMAAAAMTAMMGGSIQQSLNAASLALQNSLGMICDPIANRVEAPCLGKNIMAASNALSCTNMALADYDALIPLDEVIETMDKVGKSIPNDLCCTSLGGLSVTRTSKNIEARLQQGQRQLPVIAQKNRFKIC